MFNTCQVVGRAGADAEMRFLPTGTAVTNVPVYNNYRYAETKEDLTIFKVVFFGRSAELANQFILKGALVAASGRVRTKEYTLRDGTPKFALELVANDFRVLDSSKSSAEEQEPVFDEELDDLPF